MTSGHMDAKKVAKSVAAGGPDTQLGRYRRVDIEFSVVIATFNRGKHILPTIYSALQQTHPALEILVVGDGCTDETGEILEKEFGVRVNWFNLDRNFQTQSVANNLGILRARGTHIAYLGHDDVWSPRHLAALAEIIGKRNPDFAVSGTVCHGPEGTDTYRITGLFDYPVVAKSEFFPPSSIAHRRSITDRIGLWSKPNAVNRPVDCDFLLRAAAAGCSFVSTKRITVHKFTAAQRYLSYRFPSSTEQEQMLANFTQPGFEMQLLTHLLNRVTRGAQMIRIEYPDYEKFTLGTFISRTRAAKGLELGQPLVVDQTTDFIVSDGPGSFDWRAREDHPKFGPIRWSDRNPNPLYFLNVRISSRFSLRIHIISVAAPTVKNALRLKVNGTYTDFLIEQAADETYRIATGSIFDLPINEGLAIIFETHPPKKPLPPDPIRTKRLALGNITVVLQ